MFPPVCGPEIRAYKCGATVGCRCDHTRAVWAIYCDTESGWCDGSEATKDLQPDDIYDAYPEGMPGKSMLQVPKYKYNCSCYYVFFFQFFNYFYFTVPCLDNSSSCPNWANDNYCSYGWFTSETGSYGCRKSCGLC